MYRVEFQGANGTEIIGTANDREGANRLMIAHLNTKGIKPYYFRSWGDENKVHVDYGSWSEFYLFIKED